MIAALTLALVAAAAPAHHGKASASGITFLEDDYAGALAKAKAAKKPLFVDAWATWCHSCLSMRSFVLGDAGLRPVKDAVVWLSVETETEKNRDFVEKFPVEGLPTFLIIDPRSETVIGRWLGSSSVNEMRQFVQDTVAEYGGNASPAALAAREGHQAQQRGDLAAAADAYRKAVRLSKKDDAARPERVDLLAAALARVGTPEALAECVQLGKAELVAMPATAAGGDFALNVAGCAERTKSDEGGVLRKSAIARIEHLVEQKNAALSADDRSDLLANLASMYDDDKRHDDAVAVMRKRAALLEQAAAGAPDSASAATFDAHRTETYLYLGEAPKAEALLSAREKEFPSDYNPPARLARVLLEEKRAPEAEAAVDRALSKMTNGPRKVGILGLKGQILAAQGKDKSPVVREQLALLKSLPKTQRKPAQEQKLEAELKALGAKSAAN